jgi:hypothetical protein
MYASLADRSTRRLLNTLIRIDLIVIDEFGYLNLKPEQTTSLAALHAILISDRVLRSCSERPGHLSRAEVVRFWRASKRDETRGFGRRITRDRVS